MKRKRQTAHATNKPTSHGTYIRVRPKAVTLHTHFPWLRVCRGRREYVCGLARATCIHENATMIQKSEDTDLPTHLLYSVPKRDVTAKRDLVLVRR